MISKMRRYLDQARELKKVCNMKVKVDPLADEALDTPPNALEKRSNTIGIDTRITELQKFF